MPSVAVAGRMQNAVGVGARRASICCCAVNRTARRRSGGAWAWRRRCRTRRASVRVSRRALARRDYPAARLSARRTTRYHCWKGRGERAHRQEEQVSLSKYRADRHADRLKRRAARAAARGLGLAAIGIVYGAPTLLHCVDGQCCHSAYGDNHTGRYFRPGSAP